MRVSRVKKHKASLSFAKKVSDMHGEEIFGIKCKGVDWCDVFNAYMSLISLRKMNHLMNSEEIDFAYKNLIK